LLKSQHVLTKKNGSLRAKGVFMQPSLLITATLFLLLQGPQRTLSIQGSVTFDGIALDYPVVVYLEALGSRPVEQTVTDGFGRFTFQNLPSGTYYVRVKQQGFQEFAQRIELPAYNRDVMIFLQRKSNAPPVSDDQFALGTKYQVDVRQLSIPDKAVREYQRALDDKKKGKISSAIDRLRRALTLAPNFVEAAFDLGSALYQMGHFEEAEKALKRALMVTPKAAQLRLLLANVFVKERKYQQALAEIDAYLQGNPPDGPERDSALTTRSQLMQAIRRATPD
jgi:cytochrome c-type biogenesis protein CcmH/NrfG